MAVLDFEAYRLEYYVEGQGYYDENGDYQEGIPNDDSNDDSSDSYDDVGGHWVDVGLCNAVPAGRNNILALPDKDGGQVYFSFTIILHDPHSREYKYGERLRLTTINGMETVELTVKGFARYQHQCKVYA